MNTVKFSSNRLVICQNSEDSSNNIFGVLNSLRRKVDGIDRTYSNIQMKD